MSAAPLTTDRPRRWDSPFSAEMTDAEVDRLLGFAPFKEMNAESFPRSTTLRDILKNDARIIRYAPGEIVVREGDYGTSAFLILAGVVQIVLSPRLPPAAIGRREPAGRSFFRAFAQLWTNPRESEVFRRRKGDGDDKKLLILQDIPRIVSRHEMAQLEAGDFFGEIAALSRVPRTATLFARDAGTELVEIRWQGLRDLMRYDPKLRQHIEHIYRERSLSQFLRVVPFLQHLTAEQREKIADATRFETHGDYEWSGKYKDLVKSGAPAAAKEQAVASEGDYPNSLVLVRSGFARVTQRFGDGHRTLNYLGAGALYGFREIVHNWRKPNQTVPLQHSLRVMGYTHLLTIPAHLIEEIVLPGMPADMLPPIVEDVTYTTSPFASKLAAPRGKRLPAGEAAIGSELMEFLAQNRFYNGTEAMVIDMDRCTRCDDCVRACAATHENNPRFLRHGPIHDQIMVAQSCMHCADPVCMIGCPTGAIHRDAFGGEVVINPDSCIGCAACANNCPYGSIRMVEVRDASGAILTASDAKPILKATKCDLCNDQLGGPACERACPHDALKRINLTTLDELVPWLRR